MGANAVIRGFEIAAAYLNIGGKATFFVPAAQAFGRVGSPPAIFDEENLIIEIKVLAAVAVNEASTTNDEIRMQLSEQVKERANGAYREQKYDEALAFF